MKKPKAFAIRAVGFASGEPCPHAGQFVQSFDVNAHDGSGYGVFTRHEEQALRFKNMGEALSFWRRRSTVKPVRADGRPNAPMTALTISISQLDALP